MMHSFFLLQEYKEAFAYYDKNGDGTINDEELRNIMVSFGQDLTEDELQELMKEIDQDGMNFRRKDFFIPN